MLSRRLLRVKVVKALFGHLKSDSTNMIASEKTLLASIDKTYDLYFQLMELIVEVRRHAESRLETARRKKLPTYEDLNPNTKFVENKAIALLASSQTVNDYLSSHKLNWARYPELIKLLYTRLLASDYYRRYMQNPTRTFSEDKQLVEEFYRNELEDCEELEAALEEQSILWSDDLGFALTMVVRTLSNLRASSTDVKVLPKFKSDDDLAFVKTLFEKVLVNYDQTQRYIERFTSNWDIERIAFMDYLILATAVAELTSCPEIPVKVTLDEYIEISKYYSGPGSSVFINGVLEVAECFWGWLRGRRRGARAALRLRLSQRASDIFGPRYRSFGRIAAYGHVGYPAFRTSPQRRNGAARSGFLQSGRGAARSRPERIVVRMYLVGI